MTNRLQIRYVLPDGSSYTVTSKDTLEESGIDRFSRSQMVDAFHKVSNGVATSISHGSGITISPDHEHDQREKYVLFAPELAKLLCVEFSIRED